MRFPDNTLPGIEAGLRSVGMVEVDIRATSDGVLILSHDPDLAGKVVSESRWSDLRDVDVGAGQRAVALRDVLARFGDGAFDLEVKNDPAEPGFDPARASAVAVARLARAQDIVTSFDWESVDRVRFEEPAVTTGLLLDHPGALAGAIEHARSRGHRAVMPRWTMIDETGVRAAREAGLRLVVWTVDDPAVGRELAALGVDGIITNDPETMRDEMTGGAA